MGKSTLFNKLIGTRLAIVEDTPGITRDRIYAPCEWLGREFMLIEQGASNPSPMMCDPLPDAPPGPAGHRRRRRHHSGDRCPLRRHRQRSGGGVHAAKKREAHRPVLNKCDAPGPPPAEFLRVLQSGPGSIPFPFPRFHATAPGDLLDAVFKHLDFDEGEEEQSEFIRGGRHRQNPNVGKSSAGQTASPGRKG